MGEGKGEGEISVSVTLADDKKQEMEKRKMVTDKRGKRRSFDLNPINTTD